jgi:hypothetical protein
MALVVAVSRADTDAAIGEHLFGKEARSKGVLFGSAPSCDVILAELKDEHARLVKRADGYYFVDVGGDGFTVEDIWHEGGSELRVGDGTRISSAGLVFEFKRAVTPQRTRVFRPSETIATEGGTSTSLQAAAHGELRELSRYFISEANFETPEEIKRFRTLVQLTLEIAMEWMGQALRGRAEFQDQFSAPVTQIFSRNLNPVKRMQDITTIANFLLDWRERREIDSIRDTLRDAFNDMVRHQVGLLAGVQQFVTDLQQRLDPQQIEEEAGKGKKAWQRYTELYADTFAESSKLFNELIYPSIRKGYIFSHDDVSKE